MVPGLPDPQSQGHPVLWVVRGQTAPSPLLMYRRRRAWFSTDGPVLFAQPIQRVAKPVPQVVLHPSQAKVCVQRAVESAMVLFLEVCTILTVLIVFDA